MSPTRYAKHFGKSSALPKCPDELLSHAIDALVQIDQANSSKSVIGLRFEGIFRLLQYTDKLMAHFYCDSPIIRTVFTKKLEFIRAAKSQKEMKEIFSYSAPHYDGNRFRVDSPYHIDEEELLQWSIASERCPPSSIVANLRRRAVPENLWKIYIGIIDRRLRAIRIYQIMTS